MMSGVPLGMALGYLWGGWALQDFGWRTALILAGVPGIVIGALAFLTLPERSSNAVQVPQPPFTAVLRVMWTTKALRNMIIGAMIQNFLAVGMTLWIPSYLIRSYGMSPHEVGTHLALVFGLGHLSGALIGGRLSDVFFRIDVKWQFYMAAIAVIGAAACATTGYILGPPYVFWLLGFQVMFGTVFGSPIVTITQSFMPISARATSVACLLFVLNGFATGICPQLMGIASDLLHASYGENSLKMTLIGSAMTAFPAAYFFYRASKTYRADLTAATARGDTLK
jgi:predicted MFS family arabinose efflux permease